VSWLKLDDGFWSHPKIVGRSDAAFRLHINAMGYCAQHLTDGELVEAVLPTLYPRNVKKLVAELIAEGIWHGPDHDCPSCPDVFRGRYYIHDFLQWNPSAEKVEGERAAARERMDRLRRGRSSPEPTPNDDRTNDRSSPSRGSASPSRPVPSIENTPSSTVATSGLRPVENPDDEKLKTVFERVANAKLDRRPPGTVRDPDRYRATCLQELEPRATELLFVMANHPDAPIDVLAGWLLGEPNSLAQYHEEAHA
jgi:hypothetical protein